MNAEPSMLGPKHPAGVPYKFDLEGNVQPFPGNTIVSHLSPSSEPELYASLLALYDKLKDNHLSHIYTLLPPSSWHMTVFDGVCDHRGTGRWPDDLPDNALLAECTGLYQEKLASFDLQCDPPYRITVTGFEPLVTGIGIHFEPSTAEENARIRGLRDRLAKLLRIRSRQHDVYGLHLSVAYFLRFMTEEQEKELSALLLDHFEGMPKDFELGPPEFCAFEDMFAFKRLFYLKNQ